MSDHHSSDEWWVGAPAVGTDRRPRPADRNGDGPGPAANGASNGQFAERGGDVGSGGAGGAPPSPRVEPSPPPVEPASYRVEPSPPVEPTSYRVEPPPGAVAGAPPGGQVFVPAPEDLPPFDEVVEPIYRPEDVPPPAVLDDVPPAPGPVDQAGVPPAPDLARPPAARPVREPSSAVARAQPVDRRRLAVVYDTDGPRVRLGVAWFAGAMVAVALGPVTAALVYAVAAGFAARQIVRAWGSVPWQADLAAGLAAVPVLAAVVGTPAVVGTVVLGCVVAVGAACAPDGGRLPGGEGRIAAVGILASSIVPGVAAAMVVRTSDASVIAAVVLVLIASAYELGDYIVGSGASNVVEGPLAGVTTASLVALPLALVLVEPYDAGGILLLGLTAAACPLGQIVASALLPGAGAHAPALRRIDTLLVLAPLWAAAAGAL